MKQLEFDFNERKKQTGVDWLVEELTRQNMYMYLFTKEIEQAKAMEKEQMIDAFGVGCQVEATRLIGYHQMAEQYYNEIFNK